MVWKDLISNNKLNILCCSLGDTAMQMTQCLIKTAAAANIKCYWKICHLINGKDYGRTLTETVWVALYRKY